MKTKIVKRMLCLFLTIGIMSACLSVSASDIAPYYTGTNSITSGLSISSGGKASCTGSITLYSSYTATLTMKLQKYTGSYWSTVKTWSTSDSKYLSKTYYVTSGYTYRVVTSASVYNSSGSYVESPSATSQTVSY